MINVLLSNVERLWLSLFIFRQFDFNPRKSCILSLGSVRLNPRGQVYFIHRGWGGGGVYLAYAGEVCISCVL